MIVSQNIYDLHIYYYYLLLSIGMSSENPEMEVEETASEDPGNITLVPAEERTAKARCTIRTTRIKQEQESDDEAEEVQRAIANAEHKNVYVMEVDTDNPNQSESLKLQPMSDTLGKLK